MPKKRPSNRLIRPEKTRRDRPKAPVSSGTKKRVWTTVLLTLFLFLVYYTCMAVGKSPVFIRTVMLIYMICPAALLIVYTIYNHGFVSKGLTAEELPEDWSPEKKQAFLMEGLARAEKSRWMLTWIIPFVIVLLAEALYLFVWCNFLEPLFTSA